MTWTEKRATLSGDVMHAIEECLSFHEALRRLKFSPDDIFHQVNPDGRRNGKLAAWTMLRVRGMPEVMLLAWHFDHEKDAKSFQDEFKSAAVAWNETMTDEERRAIWEKSFARANGSGLIMTLIKKGHGATFGGGVPLHLLLAP